MVAAFFLELERVLIASYAKRRFMLHLAAVALTAILVFSGADWAYFLATRSVRMLGLPAAIIGFFVPILLPVVLYVWGELKKRSWLRLTAVAVAQAAIGGWLISSFYKIFTGRMQPEFYTFTSSADSSRDFLFGFFRHGIFWGWPSSHASVAVAMGTALIFLFPKHRILIAASIIYMLYVTLGVSVSIHWLSDALAAVLIGTAIGSATAEVYQGRIGKMSP